MRLEHIDFLIIGATKSGTTWLQRSLQRDPQVFMPDPELHFFSRAHDRGTAWYLAQFEGHTAGHRLVGEKSNSYLDDPSAASRIGASLPHARLIAQLRHPVERAYSDYCMLLRRGEVGRDIENQLDPRRHGRDRFLRGGLYAAQLRAFRDRFAQEQIKVVLYDDLIACPVEHIDGVRAFLGLAPSAVPPVEEKVKDRTTAIVDPRVRWYLGFLRPMIRPLRNSSVFRIVRSAVAREQLYPALSPDLSARLMDFYAADIEDLGRLVRRDLGRWGAGDPERSDLPASTPAG
jgi:hypothetical protein